MANVYTNQVVFSIPAQGYMLTTAAEKIGPRYHITQINAGGGLYGTSCINSAQGGSLAFSAAPIRGSGSDFIQALTHFTLSINASSLDNSRVNVIPANGLYDWYVAVADQQWYQQLKAALVPIGISDGLGDVENYPAVPYGIYTDTCQGDYVIRDKNGGGLFIGRTRAQLKQGSLAYFEVDGLTNKTVTCGIQQEAVGLTTYYNVNPLSQKSFVAVTLAQSLGVNNNKPAVVIQDRQLTEREYDLKRSQQAVQQQTITAEQGTPYYRIQSITGISVAGTQRSVKGWPVSGSKYVDYNTSAEGLAYPILSVSKQRFDGSLYNQSAHSITSIKSPAISILTAISDSTNNEQIHKKVNKLQQQWDKLTQQQQAENYSLYINQLYSSWELQQGFFFPDSLQQQAASDSLCVISSKISVKHTKEKLTAQIPSISAQKAETYADQDDPVFGQKISYVSNMSCVTQAPDGSIILTDGWGSQIRMTGGNIIISPALDIIFRPGRSVIGMIPGIFDVSSNRDITLSAKGDINAGAQGSAILASGITGKSAKTVVQNRSTTPNDGDINSGLVIRSNYASAITASTQLYIGLNDKRNKYSAQGVTRSSGRMIIDAGQQLTVRADNRIVNYTQYFASITPQSILSLQQSALMLKVQNFNIDSDISVGPIMFNDSFQLAGAEYSRPHSAVSHNIIAGGLIGCKGVVAGDAGVSTTGVITGQNYIAITQKIDTIYPMQPQSRNRFIGSVQDTVPQVITDSANYTLAAPVVYADVYICQKQFAFPDYYWKAQPMQIPGMCWQNTAMVYSNKVYQPITVYSTQDPEGQPTMSYPGAYQWKQAVVTSFQCDNENSIPQFKKNKLIGSYKTNNI